MASGLVIAPFLLFGSALAPLHVHEGAAGHSHALVHSHFEPHHLESHESDDPEFEPRPERVVWLETSILSQAVYHASPEQVLVAATFWVVPATQSWSATPFDDVAPTHGPPRRDPSYRGPPPSLA